LDSPTSLPDDFDYSYCYYDNYYNYCWFNLPTCLPSYLPTFRPQCLSQAYTMLRSLLGDFDFEELKRENSILGPLMYSCLVQ
jgi:hypothetical protein